MLFGEDQTPPAWPFRARGFGFVWESVEIINNLAALKSVRLGSFKSHVADSEQ